jgi:hypothetical protein
MDSFIWDLEGDRFYWVVWEDQPVIRFRHLTTGEERDWFRIPLGFLNNVDVSPDEKWIYYSGREQLQTDMMLVENFH